MASYDARVIFTNNFLKRVREEINAYVGALKDQNLICPGLKTTNDYVQSIYLTSLSDPEFDEMLDYNGDPATWETSWIHEYMYSNCSIQEDYPLAE